MKLKESIIEIINTSHSQKQLICDLVELSNPLYKEIHIILFSKNIGRVAYLSRILVNSNSDLDREKEMYLNNDIKNFTKEIYELREMIQNILPAYFPQYKIQKIFKNEKPDFLVLLDNGYEIGIECCSLLTKEVYEEMDEKIWKNNIGARHLNYEYISEDQLKKFKKHLKNGKETIYLFNMGGGARDLYVLK